MKATERLWLTAERDELVPDGDERAAFLFCVPGNEISDVEAERLGMKPGATVVGDKDDLARPKRMASKADWVAYAVANGADPAEADALKRDELAARFGG